MKNDKSLTNELLREDGIEPFGVSDKEHRDLRDVLEAERRRVKRLAWLVQVPLWFFAVLMLLFCVSERLLDTLRIQFVAVCGLVIVACVVLFPISFKLLCRLKAKRARLRRLYKLMPEYAEKCRGGIIIVGRRDGKRVIRWPAVITLCITISLIMGLGASGVYYLLSGRWSPVVILYVGLMGIGGVAVGIYDGLKTAPEELTELKASESSTWRTIMKSRITKLAAAAVIMIAALLAIYNIGPSSVALADVLAKVEQTKAYMYKIKMKVSGPVMTKISPWGQDMTGTVTISEDFGLKKYMEMFDPNTGATTTQEIYIIPDEKLVVMLMHKQKRFTRSEFSDDFLASMKKQHNDPRELIRRMLGVKYTELGKSEIDGVEVDGFETTDPGISSDTADAKVTLWVDSKSWLPVLVEMDMSINEQGRIRSTYYDYQWDVPVEKSDFEPVIPNDYEAGPGDGMEWPEMTEEAAIEGLRLVAGLVGRYPKQANIVDLMQELSPIMFEHIKKDLPKDTTDTELETKMMEAILPIQSIGLFYMTLVEDQKEPVYYGETVGPDDEEAVLLRWKVSDDQYRVIYGDLTTGNVSAERLAELENPSSQ